MLNSAYLMKDISLIKHASSAPGLRLFGLGPAFKPLKGLEKLQVLFNQNTSWAKHRTLYQIKQMLANSNVIITLWNKNNIVGFGRATTDQVYRAVLWDIVVSKDLQRVGLGKVIVEELLNDKKINSAEKVYLMTTDGKDFYKQLGFKINTKQSLMMLN
jgi:N-acetylglutamate synthase-like GNAT family acetyltransferase